jgi:hypothetical protein
MRRKEMIRDDLVSALEHIGWKKVSEMNGYAFKMIDHRGTASRVLLMSEKVHLRDSEAEVSFYYSDCKLEIIDGNFVSLAQKDSDSVFINFYGEKQS